jgi:zinc transporter 7
LVVAAGIVLFLLVEKVVRYVEDKSRGTHAWSHGHHHHHHKSTKILKDDDNSHDIMQSLSLDGKEGKTLEMSSEGKVSGEVSEEASKGNDLTHHELRKVRRWALFEIHSDLWPVHWVGHVRKLDPELRSVKVRIRHDSSC